MQSSPMTMNSLIRFMKVSALASTQGPKATMPKAPKATMPCGRTMSTPKAIPRRKAYSTVGETVGLSSMDVEFAVDAMLDVAAKQLNSVGTFTIAGAINMKLIHVRAKAARKGVKAKPAGLLVKASPTKKFMNMVYTASSHLECQLT